MTTTSEVLLTSEASGQMWNVCVWDFHSSTSLLTYKGGTTAPHGLAVLNNDFIISALTTKPVLNIWSLHKRDNQQMKMVCPGRVTALDVTPNGEYCIAAVSEKIHIWQVCTGHLMTVLGRHYQNVTCLRCCDDGSYFVSGGDDNMVIAWSLGRVLSETGEYSNRRAPVHVWSQHSLPITDIHIGYGGSRARVVSSSLDQSCRMWDLASGEMICCIVFDVSITSTAMNLTESLLFAGGSNGNIYCYNLYDRPIRTERHIQSDTDDPSTTIYSGHSKQVTCLSISLDGSQLVSGSHDCDVRVWDVYSGQCIKTVPHKGVVTNARLIPTPPGVVSEIKRPLLPMQPFERHLYIPQKSGDSGEDNSSDTLNLYINQFQQVTKSSDEARLYTEPLLRSRDTFDEVTPQVQETCIAEMKQEINELKSANKNLYSFAVDEILQERNKPS
ncbi:WD repeat-containing protein 18 [Mizuhopecten yessoensis]|uniref:WD repeat-containing protein 18 n=3 Tax=Mizuhopecten yessoensis TaxID=6573 RepID=A0A210R5I8_MIZYE|nr:WD repeat-containing protein 18 [Mizuhopecten yessoensis]